MKFLGCRTLAPADQDKKGPHGIGGTTAKDPGTERRLPVSW